jgi:hypothetical protein
MVFSDMLMFSLVDVSRRFRGTYYLDFQGQIVSKESRQGSSKQPNVGCILLARLMIHLDREDGCSTLLRNVNTLYQNTLRHILELTIMRISGLILNPYKFNYSDNADLFYFRIWFNFQDE